MKRINPRCIGHKDDFRTIGHDGKRTSEQKKKDDEVMKSIENLPDSYFERLKANHESRQKTI